MTDNPDVHLSRSRTVVVGREVLTGRDCRISLADLTQTSVHVVGAAGYGKSYWLRSLVDQLVRERQAFGLLDPHSELCQYAAWRLRRAGVSPTRIIPLDPGDGRYALGFDPLRCGVADAGEAAGLVLDAFVRVWGAKSMDETPRMEGILRGMLRLLIAGRLTLLEGYDLLNVDNTSLRRALRERVDDRLVQADWCEFEKLGRTEKLALVESTRNRLRRVLHAAPVRAMLGQTGHTLDLREVMDSGRYLLADLGGLSAPETQRLVGTLLINGIFHAARRRDTRRRRPWFLICDEFGQFVSADVANSLDQLRKSGCHMVLAHQRLAQLQRDEADVLSAVMTNCKIKVAFGGLEYAEARQLAPEFFTNEIRGDRVKHRTMQTKFRPVEDTFEVVTKSGSETESEADTWSESSGSSSSDSDSDTESYDADQWDGVEHSSLRRAHGSGTSHGSTSSASSGNSTSRSSTTGWSRSVVPITRHMEFHEESGRQFWSLEEEWHSHTARLHGLPKREAYIKVYGQPAVHIRTPDVQPECCDERFDRFQTSVMERCPEVKAVDAVTAGIEGRRRAMTALAEKTEAQDRPFEVRSFRE